MIWWMYPREERWGVLDKSNKQITSGTSLTRTNWDTLKSQWKKRKSRGCKWLHPRRHQPRHSRRLSWRLSWIGGAGARVSCSLLCGGRWKVGQAGDVSLLLKMQVKLWTQKQVNQVQKIFRIVEHGRNSAWAWFVLTHATLKVCNMETIPTTIPGVWHFAFFLTVPSCWEV